MSLASLSPQVINVERNTTAIDSSGGATLTWQAFVTGAQVSSQPGSAREKMLFAQRVIEYNHKFYSAYDLGVKKGDRVKIPAEGRTFIVTGYADLAGRGNVFVIQAKEQT